MVGYPVYMSDFSQRFDPQGGILGGQPQMGGGILGGGLQQLLDPSVALPIAAQLIGGRTLKDSLAGGLAAAGPGIQDMRKRQALNAYLKARSGKGDLSPEMLQYIQSNPDLGEKLAINDLGQDKPSGAYGGTSMDAQNWNIILKGKNDTPEYAAAYSQLFETPKMAAGQGPNGEITQTPYYPPVPPGIRPPAGAAPQPAPQAAAAPAQGAAPPVAAGAVRTGPPVTVGQKKPTEAEIKGRTLLANAEPDYQTAKKSFDALSGTGDQVLNELGRAGRFFQSNDYQVAVDATKNVVQSYIYAVSGAQAPEAEVARNLAIVMPDVTDKPDTIAAKRQRLDGMMDAIRKRANMPDDGQPHPELSIEGNGGAESGWTDLGNGVRIRKIQ